VEEQTESIKNHSSALTRSRNSIGNRTSKDDYWQMIRKVNLPSIRMISILQDTSV